MQNQSTPKLDGDSFLHRKRGELHEKRDRLVRSFSQAATEMCSRQMRKACKEIERTNEFIDSLNQIDAEQQAKPDDSRPRFQISSLFLYECFEKLTADDREQFFFITGTEVNGVCVLNQRAEFEHESRTAMGVIAKPSSTHRLLIKLEKFGHRLLGHFHSHPGDGPGSTHPSGTDRDFQQRLEQAGHIAVAAIFSRDGYVRFFRLDGEFEIQIHGTGVEKHEDNIYRLAAVDSAKGSKHPRRIGPAAKYSQLQPGSILGI